jgi:FMN phosphatase YigB (HAD superfamily)
MAIMIKRFFNWLLHWPDRTHLHKDPLHESAEMTEQQLFEAWAYGWPVADDSKDKMKAWNSRHSDLLILNPAGMVQEDLKKMYLLYVEHKKMRRKK